MEEKEPSVKRLQYKYTHTSGYESHDLDVEADSGSSNFWW